MYSSRFRERHYKLRLNNTCPSDIISIDETEEHLIPNEKEKEALEWCDSCVKGYDSKKVKFDHPQSADGSTVKERVESLRRLRGTMTFNCDTYITPKDVEIPFDIDEVNGDFGIFCYASEMNRNIVWKNLPKWIDGEKIFIHNLFGIKSFEGFSTEMGGTTTKNPEGTYPGRTYRTYISMILPALESFKGASVLAEKIKVTHFLSIEAKNPNLDRDFIDQLKPLAESEYCIGIELKLHPAIVNSMKPQIEKWRWTKFSIHNNQEDIYKVFISD